MTGGSGKQQKGPSGLKSPTGHLHVGQRQDEGGTGSVVGGDRPPRELHHRLRIQDVGLHRPCNTDTRARCMPVYVHHSHTQTPHANKKLTHMRAHTALTRMRTHTHTCTHSYIPHIQNTKHTKLHMHHIHTERTTTTTRTSQHAHINA